MRNIAISVRSLTVVRGGRHVLEDLDVDLPEGSLTGLLGPSGCGKTTLIRAIVGAQANVVGTVEVLGLPAGSAALRRRVAYATQAASVYPDLTVRQNLRYFADLTGHPAAAVDAALHTVDLTHHAADKVGNLSGGQRARVSLAAALVGDPDVYLLDEPTVGLDPVLRFDLWQMFADLAGAGRTVLVSSHVMDEAARCQRVLLMRSGVFVADDTPAGLLASTGASDLDGAFLAVARRQPAIAAAGADR